MTDDLVERMTRAYWAAPGHKIPWRAMPTHTRNEYRNGMRAALAAIKETHAIVPREPTEAMLEIGERTKLLNGYISSDDATRIYKAMIAEAGE
jgi:hypothetical protein